MLAPTLSNWVETSFGRLWVKGSLMNQSCHSGTAVVKPFRGGVRKSLANAERGQKLGQRANIEKVGSSFNRIFLGGSKRMKTTFRGTLIILCNCIEDKNYVDEMQGSATSSLF
jgi:hypothetical protein